MRVSAYVNREDFIVERCRGRRVLDCGVVGLTELASSTRVEGVPSGLHVKIAAVASEILGLDNAECTSAIAAAYPNLNIRKANIEVALEESPFDTVVMGDIIEHLSNPGMALDSLRPLVRDELIVSCPNAFGAPNYLRFLTGRFREGMDHVASHNRWTLSNLLLRHGYRPVELYTCLDRNEAHPSLAFRLALRFLKIVPNLGGTLLVVARPDHRIE